MNVVESFKSIPGYKWMSFWDSSYFRVPASCNDLHGRALCIIHRTLGPDMMDRWRISNKEIHSFLDNEVVGEVEEVLRVDVNDL